MKKLLFKLRRLVNAVFTSSGFEYRVISGAMALFGLTMWVLGLKAGSILFRA